MHGKNASLTIEDLTYDKIKTDRMMRLKVMVEAIGF
jgi:hypothetical protein